MFEKEISLALIASEEASEAIRKVYENGFHAEYKEDNSPVTEADKQSEEIIRSLLEESFPADSFLSEETPDDGKRLSAKRVWIIDPLDGTKDFVEKNDEFTINIALSVDGKIVLGLICSPVLHKTWYAVKGQGAFVIENGARHEISVSKRKKGEWILLCSSSPSSTKEATDFYLANPGLFVSPPLPLGSSLKMAIIAEGKADLFFRTNDVTKEWDVAPAQIILEEAGGHFVSCEDMNPFIYNKKDIRNHYGYLASSNLAFACSKRVKKGNS